MIRPLEHLLEHESRIFQTLWIRVLDTSLMLRLAEGTFAHTQMVEGGIGIGAVSAAQLPKSLRSCQHRV